MKNTKEVIFELTGKTELNVTKKCKVTLDETIDIENLPEGLDELIKNRFLRDSNQSFQEETVTILKDEDCDLFENERENSSHYDDDNLIYMSEKYGYPDYVIKRTPQWGHGLHLREKGIKSWMTFGQMDKDSFDCRTGYERYFIDYWSEVPTESFGLSREKDEIVQMWRYEDFKSIKKYCVEVGYPLENIPFKKYQNLFHKQLPNKTYKKIGGVFLLVISDIESIRRNGHSRDSTILEMIIL